MGEVTQTPYKTLRLLIKDEKDQINPKLTISWNNWQEWLNKELGKWGYEAKFKEIRKYSYENKEGKLNYGFEIRLEDEVDGDVRFTCLWTNPSRRFVNYLAGWTGEIGKIKLSTSAKEYNGRMQTTLWLNIDGQMSNLLIGKEDMEKYIVAIKDPDTQEIIKYKYNKLEEKLESEYENINKRAKKTANLVNELVASVEQKPSELKDKISQMKEKTAQKDAFDDLPF